MMLAVLTPVKAQTSDPGVLVELNKLESKDTTCRAYIVLKNRSRIVLSTLKIDFVVFDTDGIVTKRLAVELGPLPSDKTSLKVFDIEELHCTQLGRLLVNDVAACEDDSGPRSDCLALLSTSTRASVPFVK